MELRHPPKVLIRGLITQAATSRLSFREPLAVPYLIL